MNYETYIRLATEAGLIEKLGYSPLVELEAFTKLVEAHERERVAKVLEDDQWMAAAALARGKR